MKLSSFSIITYYLIPLLFLSLPSSSQQTYYHLLYSRYHIHLSESEPLMYITVPTRKNKDFKAQKKHQELLFKEIGYNSIFQSIKQQQQLRKNNGFKPFKHKIIQDTVQNTLRKTNPTLRRTSLVSQKFKHHRQSVSSIFSTSKDKANYSFFKTAEDFSDYKLFQTQDLVIKEKPQERQSWSTAVEGKNPTVKNVQLQKQDKEKQNMAEGKHQRNRKMARNNKKRKTVTLLDLKVKNIEKIIRSSGKSQDMDYHAFVQKEQKSITKSCWNKFYGEMIKNSNKRSHNVQQKIITLRKATTSHQKRSTFEPQNQVQQLLIQKQNKQSKSQSVSPIVTPRHSHHPTTSLHLKPNPLESQSIHKYYNFVRGFQHDDEYSQKMSLGQYRNSLRKYYILKNSEQAVKQSVDYKKITMENLKNYKPEDVVLFMYLNDNHYKFMTKKNQAYLKDILP